MKITEVKKQKKRYLPLLLLADEQEDMIDKYINRGRMFILDDGGIKASMVVTREGRDVLEIKNLAVASAYQKQGYGRIMIDFILDKFAGEYTVLQAGTGDSPVTIGFYEKCGFKRTHKIKNFFLDNYDKPIFDGGVQLTDMIYLRKAFPLRIMKIWEFQDMIRDAAGWFSGKWNIPQKAYMESMKSYEEGNISSPRWYVVLNSHGDIIAGAGVIDNDFHERTDLSPNICALFVEKEYRNIVIAANLLDFIRKDLGRIGCEKIYLVTDHREFYEKCGWEFFGMVRDSDGNSVRMYIADTLK